MNPTIGFKNRGTFQLTAYYQGLAGEPLPTGIKSEVKLIVRLREDVVETLVAELDVTMGDGDQDAGTLTYILICSDTSAWPEAVLQMDVLYTYADGRKTHTETLNVVVKRGITA